MHMLGSVSPCATRRQPGALTMLSRPATPRSRAWIPSLGSSRFDASFPCECTGEAFDLPGAAAPAGRAASWAQSFSEVIHRTNVTRLASLETCTLPIAHHCRDAFAVIPLAAGTSDEPDPLDWKCWVISLQRNVQDTICERVGLNNFQSCNRPWILLL